MPVVESGRLVALQRHPNEIRNICILAHVDHGKTSLTDALLVTNGIISSKMAGKARYLDSRPDEQLRGITMESSAISLHFSMSRKASPSDKLEQKEYLINLIDSPGHIDFSSEVSTASRLCDGAVVLVDAVEGVCSQTITVLRHTWTEHLKPLLVINKIDRLILELKMTPAEAYSHLSKLLEQVNAVIGSFFQGERMEEDLKWRERMEDRIASKTKDINDTKDSVLDGGEVEDFLEKDDENLYFAPEKNNVVFSSAIDGWAFTVKQFSSIYEKKLGIKKAVMEKVLWGDFYLDPKTKRVLSSKHLKGRSLKPMFVQLVLEPLWSVYEATVLSRTAKGDSTKIEKILTSLNITLPVHVLRSKDQRAVLTAILTSWLPLSVAILVSVIEFLPSPIASQKDRLPRILDETPGSDHIDSTLRESMTLLKSGKKNPVVAFVSKMVAVSIDELPDKRRNKKEPLSSGAAQKNSVQSRAANNSNQDSSKDSVAPNEQIRSLTGKLEATSLDENAVENVSDQLPEDEEQLIGFARIFSGTLSVGDEVYILPPKFNPANPFRSPQPKKTIVTGLYLLMGRGLEPLDSVPAGVVFGIAGIGEAILKSGTVCSQLEGSVNLAGVSTGSQPIVRVAIEPQNPGDLKKMIAGCKLLEQSDPCAEYEVLENGEHVISTAGELHLERCLKDLRERFAKCEIQAGEPIVPYRETIISAAEMAAPKNPEHPRGTVINSTSSKQISIRIRVRPLPIEATNFLENHSEAIKRFYSERSADSRTKEDFESSDDVLNKDSTTIHAIEDDGISLPDFKSGLNACFGGKKGDANPWTDIGEKIAAFGPRSVGPNIFVDATKGGMCYKFLDDSNLDENTGHTRGTVSGDLTANDFAAKIIYAFQLATAQGPLCQEPVQGIAVFLEEVALSTSSNEKSFGRENLGRLTSEVIKTVRDSIKQGFLDWSPRILLALYSCEIQASAEVLGKVYAVITRRRGRILSETMKEGTPFFSVLSVLPVAESFGFSDEIRKRTSGAASPQLIFHGFEMLDEDPFWVPFTEEDLEDLGELADKENVAKRYMDKVRKRKGLMVQGQKLVKDAEKQKNLKR